MQAVIVLMQSVIVLMQSVIVLMQSVIVLMQSVIVLMRAVIVLMQPVIILMQAFIVLMQAVIADHLSVTYRMQFALFPFVSMIPFTDRVHYANSLTIQNVHYVPSLLTVARLLIITRFDSWVWFCYQWLCLQ